MTPDDARAPRVSCLHAIAEAHERYDDDRVRADRLRGARVALVAPRGRAGRWLAREVERAGGELVAADEAPGIAVCFSGADPAVADGLAAAGCDLVDEEEARAIVAAHRRVYRSRAIRDAIGRALAAVGCDVAGRAARLAEEEPPPPSAPAPAPTRGMRAAAPDRGRTPARPRRQLDIAAERLELMLELQRREAA